MKRTIIITLILLFVFSGNVFAIYDQYLVDKGNAALKNIDSDIHSPLLWFARSNFSGFGYKLEKNFWPCCACFTLEDPCIGWGCPTTVANCMLLDATTNIYLCDVEWICGTTNVKKKGECTRQGPTGQLIACGPTTIVNPDGCDAPEIGECSSCPVYCL